MSNWKPGDPDRRGRDPVIEENKKQGFVVRYELLGIIAIMLIQTMAGIWWAATLTTDLSNVKKELVEIKLQLSENAHNSYTASEAAKDLATVHNRIDRTDARLLLLEQTSRIKPEMHN